mmetsp:Transcript_20015/g.29678  ORF Transcript_20015/g.29678 Transcript_20015/m.29678 type:complete len:469 (+) Transcript_20015:61-1467(+)
MTRQPRCTFCALLLLFVLFLASCCVSINADASAQVNTAKTGISHQPRITAATDVKKIKNNATNSATDDQIIPSNNNTTALDNNNTIPVSSAENNITQKEVVDPVDSILSDISSWMKKQQANNAAQIDEQLFVDRDDSKYIQQPRILRRPFITLSYAQTLDGMIAAKLPNQTTTSNMKISSPESLVLTHRLRKMHDAILIGGSTFALDEPRLNARLPKPSLQQPMPIVLDTHLRHLQQILFDTIFPTDSTLLEETTIPTDMSVERIRATNPIICCSNQAAFSFIDLMEIFQDVHLQRKRPKTSYKIIVYKKIDENDHMEDACMPIKITVHVTHHYKKEEDVTQEVTFTLLPCPINERTNSVSLKHAMYQLCDQFEIRSVMVEGGAGILSSFLNECNDDDDNDESELVHCVCVTIAPTVLGGLGLPSLGGLDALMKKSDEEDEIEESLTLKIIDGRFIPLGRDCVFLGRL